jgi:hypothetical protein
MDHKYLLSYERHIQWTSLFLFLVLTVDDRSQDVRAREDSQGYLV